MLLGIAHHYPITATRLEKAILYFSLLEKKNRHFCSHNKYFVWEYISSQCFPSLQFRKTVKDIPPEKEILGNDTVIAFF